MDTAPPIPARGGASNIRRYDGQSRTETNWDGLRKDAGLWSRNADCLVHFYAPGASRRGPSLRVPFSLVEDSQCNYLLEQCLRRPGSPRDSVSEDSSVSDSGYASSEASWERKQAFELFVPAPQSLSTEQAFRYHIRTRNYFAYLMSQPLVGETLHSAMQGLLERIAHWQTSGSESQPLDELLQYADAQGYLSMAENPQYALTVLCFAESVGARELWVEAFAHCVGMHEYLDLIAEYAFISNTTKALITRASLEMDLHIARVSRALGVFLEEELGTEHLGLSKGARDHLDRFRSVLHAYYVEKLGYFPLSESAAWDKQVWMSMYDEFHNLYSYLVDSDSAEETVDHRKAAQGGICVLQNVQAFDKRHGYPPLPHPLPLVPEIENGVSKMDTQKGLRSFRLGRMESKAAEKNTTIRQALAAATNAQDSDILACPLVQEYQRFERQRLEEKVPVADARRVRWLLVYGALQMLISITRAPKEVRDTETPLYPLCVLTSGCPPWEDEIPALRPSADYTPEKPSTPNALEEDSERISIHPDCEAASAGDYFTQNSPTSRRGSQMSLSMTPHPLRITTPISRTASIRTSVHSSVHSLHRTMSSRLCPRNSVHRNSLTSAAPRPGSGYCEILVQGYGNGSDSETSLRRRPGVLDVQAALNEEHAATPKAVIDDGFDFGLGEVNDEPTLEDFHLDLPADATPIEDDDDQVSSSSSESDISPTSSNRSSAFVAADYDSPDTDISSWDSGSYRKNSTDSPLSTVCDSPEFSPPSTPRRKASYQQKHLNFGVTTTCSSLNAGCYQPSGAINLPVSRFSITSRRLSDESIKSEASSQYTENQQAADIEEEEMRGRRRSRALDKFAPSQMQLIEDVAY